MRASHPDAVMFFIVPPGLDELEGRLRRRGDTSEVDIQKRLEIAQREMEEAERLFDHVVINDVLERAIDEVDRLMTEAPHPQGRPPDDADTSDPGTQPE